MDMSWVVQNLSRITLITGKLRERYYHSGLDDTGIDWESGDNDFIFNMMSSNIKGEGPTTEGFKNIQIYLFLNHNKNSLIEYPDLVRSVLEIEKETGIVKVVWENPYQVGKMTYYIDLMSLTFHYLT